MKKLLLIIALVFFSHWSLNVVAEQVPLLSEMSAYLVTKDKEGKEKIELAESVYPNDIVQYQLTYTNQTDGDLKGLIITGPIPANTNYIAGSARTDVQADFVVSIDGGNTFESEPVKRIVEQDGKQVEIIIPADQYNAVRWIPTAPMTKEEIQEFTYRIQVN